MGKKGPWEDYGELGNVANAGLCEPVLDEPREQECGEGQGHPLQKAYGLPPLTPKCRSDSGFQDSFEKETSVFVIL